MPCLLIPKVPMPLKKINDEVYYCDDRVVKVSQNDIKDFQKKALANERERVRLCSHRGTNDTLHEMLIVHTKGTYIRPHKHSNKSESFHVIEGMGDVVIYDDAGEIQHIVEMGDYLSGKCFYYRISDPLYHTLRIHSDFFIFHETTNGPFKREDTVFAPWSPEEKDIVEVKKFMKELSLAAEAVKGKDLLLSSKRRR